MTETNSAVRASSSASRKRLLLVEDDEMQREVLCGALNASGYTVAACENADEALEGFWLWQPEVAVIDLRLPGMDGLALAARLRESDPTLGVLIVTMAPKIPAVVEALQLGAADFLVKPVTPERLRDAVEAAMRKRAADRQKEIQRLLHETQLRALEEVNEQLNVFAGRVAHDLRTPVRVSRLWIEFAREALANNDLDGADGYLKSALKSMGAGSSVIDGLLALSKSSLLPLRASPVSLEPMIQSTVEACRVEFHPKVFDVQIDVQGSLTADVVLIGIALSNVIHNAFKYSSLQASPRIEILAAPLGPGSYGITVSDNGMGIAEQQIDRLFRPFERLSAGTQLAGEGIGLCTVKRVIDKHRGTIAIRSAEGTGTTVAMTFPEPPPAETPSNPAVSSHESPA